MRPPIIIGSAPSSGSTLLRVILGRHPSIAAGGEVALLDKRNLFRESPESYAASIEKWLDKGYPAEYLGPSEELFGDLTEYPWDRQSLREMCVAMPDYGSMVDTFFEQNASARGAQRWLDKCPSNIYCFDLIAERYPEARFIHIVRDARDTIISYCRRGAPLFRAVGRWYFANLSGLQYSGGPNYLQVRYEDLVQNAETVIRRICAFLDEPYLDSMLQADSSPPKPRHAAWRYSERGPIQASLAAKAATLSEEQRTMFARIRLSPYGYNLLHRSEGASVPRSPLELQEFLGYDSEGLTNGANAEPVHLRAAWDDFRQYRGIMWLRYGVRIGCPVTLEDTHVEGD